MAFVDPPRQIQLATGEDAYVHPTRGQRALAVNLVVGEQGEQAALHVAVELAHLVQEQGAAIGFFDTAGGIFHHRTIH